MTRKNIRAVSRGHDEATVESLRKDPKFAVEYLNAVLQEGDERESHGEIQAHCRQSHGPGKTGGIVRSICGQGGAARTAKRHGGQHE